MIKLELTKCEICGETKSSRGFSFHISQTHKIQLLDYIVKYVYNGVHPICKCGCGKEVTIRGYQVMEYKDGHSPEGHYKKGEKPARDRESWLVKVTKGIRDFNIKAKKDNPNYRTGENSNSYGHKMTEDHKNKIRINVEQQIKDGKHPFIGNANGRIGKSSLEVKFENYLIQKNIPYIHNFKIGFVPEGKESTRYKYYDFFLPNEVLVELHGSYWHPKEYSENLTEMQYKNFTNDLFKVELASKHNYKLVTIYDHEIDEYIEKDLLLTEIDA